MGTSSKKNILSIIGSASEGSSNLRLVQYIRDITAGYFNMEIVESLKHLPHFDPDLSTGDTPAIVSELRAKITAADGIIICTPEYVFSIPSCLKNMIEWCVATTVFSGKPAGLITASAHGVKGHEELQLLMRTVEAVFNDETTLLVQGIKGKVSLSGEIIHSKTRDNIATFVTAFTKMMEEQHTNEKA